MIPNPNQFLENQKWKINIKHLRGRLGRWTSCDKLFT